jgi:predicted RNA-binding Zn-ribbon protein involved in translation (DUF1610 family)
MAKKITTRKKSRRPARPKAGNGRAGKSSYVCGTCGKASTFPSHLCTPTRALGEYICAYCGIASTDPRHICSPMLTHLKYACKNCGRVSPNRNAVCKPVQIA